MSRFDYIKQCNYRKKQLNSQKILVQNVKIITSDIL